MIELTISGRPLNGIGQVLGDSDSIFVIFNNQLDEASFATAVVAAEQLPEPSTAAIVAAAGLALIGLRRKAAERRVPGAAGLRTDNILL